MEWAGTSALQGGERLARPPMAAEKLADMFAEAHSDTSALAGHKVGQFNPLEEGRASRVQVRRNAVKRPTQMAEQRIPATRYLNERAMTSDGGKGRI